MNTVFFDSETSGLDPFIHKITLVQVYQEGQQIKWSTLQDENQIKKLKDLLENNLVVGQNLKFDLKFLRQQYGIEPTNLFDTQIAELLISGGQKARQTGATTLETLAKQYLGIQLNKDPKTRTSFKGDVPTPDQLKYASMDVAVLPGIYKKQLQQLKIMGLEKIFDIEMKCIPATVWLELSGLPIDLRGLKQLEEVTKKKIEEAELKVLTLFKDMGYRNLDLSGVASINLNSPAQLLEALQSVGIKVDSTGDEVISALEHPIGKALKNYKKQQKLLTGFIYKYPEHVHKKTGRIQPEFNQYGTNTGRFTSNRPNMQQVPKDESIRNLFKAGDGNSIITADYSQIELRIIAEVSREPKFIEIYKEGRDLHRLTAALLLNKKEEDVTKDERQQAKAVNFGFAYGLGADSFREKAKKDYDLDISESRARKFRSAFFQNYPVLSQYLRKVATEAAISKRIINKSGRIVVFNRGLESWQYENMGRNTPIQSLSADITKLAMGRLYLNLKPFNASLINAVHDELVFEVKNEYAEQAAAIIKEEMESAGKEYLKSVPCTVEVIVGDTWQK